MSPARPIGGVHEVPIQRFPGGGDTLDAVAREEPLELIVDGEPLAVLLRTPGTDADDLALMAGFLYAEGVIEERADLAALRPCDNPRNLGQRVHAVLASGVRLPESARRGFATSASCGLCGKTTIESIRQRLPARAPAAPPRLAHIGGMDALVRARQAGFAATGALHAAAIFAGAELVDLAEDVGRHNAVDRVVGRALLADRLPLAGHTLWVSGRTSFELVQKALMAGLDALIAVGAPSSLAIELALAHGLHLIGFARGDRLNVYAGSVAP